MEDKRPVEKDFITFKEYFSYIKSYSFKISIAFLIIMVLVALAIFYNWGGMASAIQDFTAGFMEGLDGLIDESGQINTLALIFNNIRVTFVAFLLGLIPFIFLPAFVLAINAAVVGGLLGFISMESIVGSVSVFILGILPHGILELPAIFFGVAAGLFLCSTITKKILKKDSDLVFFEAFFNGIKLLVFVCIPLMIVAGLIETYITPLLLNLTM